MHSYHDYTDPELLFLLKESNEEAFTALFDRYRGKLYYYLLKHTKSSEIAEELVTDIFMKLWTGRELAAQINDLGAFLHKVAYYKAMDFLRTTARSSRLKQVYIDRAAQTPEAQPDEILLDAEAKALLCKAINQLPPQRKLIYQLSRQEGLSHEEIAGALHLSRSTVNNALVAATRSIAQYLQDQSKGNAALSLFFFFA